MSKTTSPAAETAAPGFSIAPAAAARIVDIISQQGGGPDVALRVAVESGGCNGFQYKFKLDSERAADDAVIEKDGATVVLDPVSLDLLSGAQLEFVDKLMGAHFTVSNPNASSACGCGTSFSMA